VHCIAVPAEHTVQIHAGHRDEGILTFSLLTVCFSMESTASQLMILLSRTFCYDIFLVSV